MYQLSTIIKGLMLVIFVAVLNINFVSAQNCNATLSVEKDRNAQSAYTEDGATFNMVLTNTSSKKVTYIISSTNLEESCANDAYKTSAPNVALNVAVKSSANASVANNALTLAAGETRKFKIYVSVPARTPSNVWSCIKISAKGSECAEPSSSTTLRVYVPEPSEG
ncbi:MULTISPECIES: FixG Ig-like domain-containing protein [Aequorivita]|uniref:FixG Ig-like domain-containing protein n=2 Tax=Aequorivita TaxID=153265 RepID=A0AB35YTB2_9FLAO|nr:FixG Ig-like domain-containing protein [Aequorivita sp. Ant34-E75]WGF91327.1 FixG Ig-like domain-containing protein [Aequorivita sp. Ant34-E75]